MTTWRGPARVQMVASAAGVSSAVRYGERRIGVHRYLLSAVAALLVGVAAGAFPRPASAAAAHPQRAARPITLVAQPPLVFVN